jgi:large subunit ribosomal protein L15
MSENETTGPIGLHELSPAPGSRRPRKRVGRGTGSGTGKTSGRGQKGQKSRSGSHMMRAGFEGGQNPLNMLLGKQRGPHKKTSMPFGPFRTVTTGVNLRDIARRVPGDADVTPESMLALKVVSTLRHPVKVLSVGECSGVWHVRAHGFSAAARQKIEAAGGSATVIEELEAPVAAPTKAAPAKSAAPAKKAKAKAEPAAAEPVVEEAADEDVVVEDVVAEVAPEADAVTDDEAEA